MKNKIFIYSVILFLFAIVLCSCSGGPTSGTEKEVIIKSTTDLIEIKSSEVLTYDFKKLFTIKEDNVDIEVLDSYIDKSDLKDQEGTYIVKCIFSNKSASLNVKVIGTDKEYTLNLSVEKVEVKQSAALNYDYKSLFSALEDGNSVTITDEMITSNVTNIPGTYSYTVKFGGNEKTLIVVVLAEHSVEVIVSYKNVDIEIDKIDSFDYTSLFSIYADNEAVKVTNEMIDKSSIVNPTVGKNYQIKLSYNYEGITCNEVASITIVETKSIIINAKNIVTYPNAEYIDLTSLFEIKYGNEDILVTADMISGTIDYSKVGNNEITLTYQGISKTANVEVRRGVVIEYAKSDTIVVLKGTNQNNYSFINDFKVMINGIHFTNIPESYFDLANLDFNTVGTYTVKITIPYNEKNLSLSGVNFTYYDAIINYVVVEKEYKIEILKEELLLNIGTNSYNVFNNLNVEINGKTQTLVTNKDYVDIISCYAEILSKPIDFNYFGVQEVKIAVYPNGVNSEPVIVTYKLMIDSQIEINAFDKAIFIGETLYTKELFTIFEGNNEIDVTNDMIEGKVDSFTSGTYYVTINYKNIEKTAKVVVFDNKMVGTYKTNLTTLPVADSTEEDDYGFTNPGTRPLGNLVISSDGTMVLDGKNVELIGGIDENTMIIKYSRNEYTLHYVNEGIIILDPDNSIRLQYNDDKRPMIYFNQDIWTINSKFVVNTTSKHALVATSQTTSIDAFEITSVDGTKHLWYSLVIDLLDKTSMDTNYRVRWGETVFANGFKFEVGAKSSVTFEEDTYQFIVKTAALGQTTESVTYKYANKTFIGTFNGKTAELRVDANEAFSLYVDSKAIFRTSIYEMSNMRYGGVDYLNDTVLIYEIEDDFYSYKFSLDVDNLTFIYLEKDMHFGKYVFENTYIFLDGYGTGHINFDTNSYYKTGINYIDNGDSIELKYIDKNVDLYNGYHAKFNTHAFGNVITSRYFTEEHLVNKTFENVNITKGASVKINSYQVGADSDTVAKQTLLDNIDIITKDGHLDYNQKLSCVDTSKVRFNTAGFYQFAITIEIDGVAVTSYYALQILEPMYQNNPIVAAYGSGVLFSENSITIDKYGQVILNCNGDVYRGMIKVNADNTFVINAANESNAKVQATGNFLTKGLINLRCTGAVTFADYFTTGFVRVTGCTKNYLREINTGSGIVYIYALSENSLGEIVNVNELGNDILEIVSSDRTFYVKVISWENLTSGLLIEDGYRGTYSTNSTTNLTVDGFGKVIINSTTYNYTLNEDVITVELSGEIVLYRLNKDSNNAEKVDVALTNDLLVGKTYESSHKFVCGQYSFNATTKFTFKENGQVLIVSTSTEHDSGDYACGEDLYEPSFANQTGVLGTFSVSANKVTITVNGETFVFIINNVLKPNEITCLSTTIDKEAHGYFQVGTVFKR